MKMLKKSKINLTFYFKFIYYIFAYRESFGYLNMEDFILKYIKAKNRKRIIKGVILSVFLIIGFAITSLFMGSGTPSNAEANTFKTTTKKLPINSSPEYETDLDNLAYLAYNIETNKNFKSESIGEAKAQIMGIPYIQKIHDERIVNSEYMFQQTISTSTFVSFGLQKFYLTDKIIRRSEESINGDNVEWKNEPNDAITYKLSDEIYGWTPDQISAYILCSDTIISTERISNGENGYYEIKYSLNPKNAPYKYQNQVKEYGGASSYPGFNSIELTFKFNSNWILESVHTEEDYVISMMNMNLNIKTNINENFTYNDIQIKESSFFLKYKNMEAKGEKDASVLDAQGLLLEGFSDLLNGENVTYKLELNINDKKYDVLLKISLNDKHFIVNIMNELYLNIELDNSLILINYHNLHLKYNIDLNYLNSFITFIKSYFKLDNTIDIDISNIDLDSIAKELLKSEVIIDEDNSLAKISSTLNLFNIELPIEFTFSYSNGAYSFKDINTNFNINGNNISINVETTQEKINFNNSYNYQSINDLSFILDEVMDLLNSDSINLDFNLDLSKNNIAINGNINYLLKANILEACINISYQNNNYIANIYYSNNIITIKYEDLVIEFNINEANDILSKIDLVQFNGSDLIAKLIEYIKAIDLNKTIDSLLINNSNVELTLYLKNNNSYKGSINRIIDGLNINIVNLMNINITKSTISEINIPKGMDLTSLLNIAAFISNNKDSSYLLSTSIQGNIYGYDFILKGDLIINNDLSILFNGNINIENKDIPFKIIYINNYIYLTIFNKTISLSIAELKSLLPSDIDINTIVNLLSHTQIEVVNNEDNILINASMNYNDISLNSIEFKLEKHDYLNIDIPDINYDYTDINNIIDVVNDIINITKNNSLEIKFNSRINDNITLGINGIVEINNKSFDLNISLVIYSNNLDINIKYINNYFYLTYQNIKIKLTLEEIKSIINRYITIDNIEIDFSNIISLLDTLELTTSKNELNITIDLPKLGKISTSINTLKGLVVSISDIEINGINLSEISFNLNETSNSIELANDDYLEYSNLEGLLDIIDNLIEIINNKNIGINIGFDLLIGDISANINIIGSVNIDSNEARFNIELKVLNTTHIINLVIINNEIRLAYGNIAIKLNTDEFIELIDYIANKYNLDSFDIDSSVINDIISKLTINGDKDTFSIVLDLNELINELSLSIKLLKNDKTIDIVIDDISTSKYEINNISININSNLSNIVVNSDSYLEYDDIINIINNIDSIINITKKKSFNLSFNAQIMNNDYVRFDVEAKAYILVNDNGSIDLEVSLDLLSMTNNDSDYTIDFVIKNNYCYLDIKLARRDDTSHDYLRVSANVNDILSILGTLSKLMGIDIPLLDKFIDGDISLDKDSLGLLIPNKDEVANICFSDYLKSINSSSDELKIVIDGMKLFNANDDLEIILGKINGSSDINHLNINNIYTNNTLDSVEKFNIDLCLIDEEFIIADRDYEYIDISTLNELLKAFVNTSSLNDFNIKGSFVVDATVGISIKMTIDFEAIIKLDENKVPSIIIKFKNIPVIVGVNNDVPYSFGDTDGGGYRDLTLYFKNNNVYLYRTEEISRFAASSQKFEKKLYTTLDLFLGDIYYYLLQVGFGFSDSIISSIKDGMNIDENHVIDLAKVVNSYLKVNDNTYNLSISLGELTGNDQLGNMNLSIMTSNIDNKNYISSLGLDIDINVSVLKLKISTNDMELINITETIDISELENYINNYQYRIDELWTARSGKWNLASSIDYLIIFDCNNGNDLIEKKYKYNDLIIYPKFKDYELINGKYMIFNGWYKDSEFSEDSLFDSEYMPRGDIKLYAKWEYASTGLIEFETEYGENPEDIYLLEGSILNLPSMPLIQYESSYYSFLYWSYNGEKFEYDIMPKGEFVLKAVWELVVPKVRYNNELIDLRDFDEKVALIKSDKGFIYNSLSLNEFINIYSNLSIDLDSNSYIFDTSVYSFDYFNNINNDYYYIEYNIDSKYNPNNYYIGIIYSKNIKASYDIPSYEYGDYIANAWFSSNNFSNDNLVLDFSTINENTILYPYYSTNNSYFIYDKSSIIGINNTTDTVIIPILNNGIVINNINDKAFSDNKSIKNLIISIFITTIGQDAFKNCDNLVNLYMGDNVTSCSNDAFYMSSSSKASRIVYYSNNNNINISSLIAYKSFGSYKYYSSIKNFKNPKNFNLNEVIRSYVL